MSIQSDLSPVTGIIDEASVIIDFGAHEGRTVSEIFEVDRDFYERLTTIRETGNFSIRRNSDKTFRLYINPLVSI